MLNDRLLSMPVMSIQTGSRLATITSAVIDPRRLRVVAFYCQAPGLEQSRTILHADDIREVADIGLIINSTDDIMSPDDLIRLKEVLDFKFQLVGKEVVDDSGHKLGKVASYSVEVETFYIIKLNVRPGFLKSLQTAERIVDRTQVVEITTKNIVVKSPIVKEEKAPIIKPLPVADNPFRPQRPQTDTATTEERL